MISRVEGVLLSAEDAQYAAEAFEQLLRDRRPSAQLREFIDRLRKAGEKSGVSGGITVAGARIVGGQGVSAQYALYDLLDTGEAAKVLGITANGVRDLRRRGVLPGHRAGGRYFYPAAAVIARAERRR
ncbi:helix-turn-helix domain-containing protein [Mycobacterium sp. WMMD1722]|uniref:helix-turn-helix domain-containing protein n=1 Tax=Mycobacterium sp. WMMD1722 TaxID=3404117 RepID=UPI003BF47E6C